ncbi:MAG: site-specific DNA-methyltransferase [Candidatus Korobacteraceae bacterium]
MLIREAIHGDAKDVLKTLKPGSVDCVVTSPPYYNLREYGSRLGTELSVAEYIKNLMSIFSEVHKVLKDTGNVFVVIGTTFYNKSDLMIPEQFALAMRFAMDFYCRYTWLKRRTIIWHKPSCLPQSVKDDFTLDFEYVYHFVKSKDYYWNQIFEPYAEITLKQKAYGGRAQKDYSSAKAQNPSDTKRRIIESIDPERGRNKRCVWSINPPRANTEEHFAVFPEALVEPMILAGCPENGTVLDPFVGSGTTCLVARRLGRGYIGIDVNAKYVEMTKRRLSEEMS